MSIKLNDVQQIAEIKGKALINVDGKFAQIETALLKGARGEQGPKGEIGPQGANGTNGKDGITPNITIGSVTTLEAGQQATVTKKGTVESPIFNFGIPKGDKGIYVGSKDTAPLTANIVIDDSDEGLYMNELIETPIKNSTLNLVLNKYQTTKMEDNTTIVLPNVDKFTEIHLFFSAESKLTLILPSSVKWQNKPTIESGKTYEFIFTYTTEWLGGCVAYG